MGFQAFASNARILLLYPIITRVVGADESLRFQEDKEARGAIESARRRAGKLIKPLDDAVDAMNSVTKNWVPESWLEGVTKGRMSDEARAAAYERQRDRYATLFTVLFLFFVMIFVMTLSAFFEDYVNELVRQRMLMDVRKALTAKLLEQPVSFYDASHR